MNRQVQTLLNALEEIKSQLPDEQYKQAIEYLMTKHKESLSARFDVEIMYAVTKLSSEDYLSDQEELSSAIDRTRSNYLLTSSVVVEKYQSLKIDSELFEVLGTDADAESGLYEVEWDSIEDFVFSPNGIVRQVEGSQIRIMNVISGHRDIRVYIENSTVMLRLTRSEELNAY